MTRTLLVEESRLFQLLQVPYNIVVYTLETKRTIFMFIVSICIGRRNSELPGRLRAKNVAGKAVMNKGRSPMLRKPLSPVTSNILNSPEDHKDAYTTKSSPKTNDDNRRTTVPSAPTTPAATVAMSEATTPFTPGSTAVKKRMDKEEGVEYSFEEVRAGFC